MKTKITPMEDLTVRKDIYNDNSPAGLALRHIEYPEKSGRNFKFIALPVNTRDPDAFICLQFFS